MNSQEQFVTNLEKIQENIINNQHWTPEQEKLLKMWAEKASGYRWMHSRTEKHYNKLSKFLGIPLIVLNTVAGTTLFSTMDSNYSKYFQVAVGITTMFTTILAGIQNFLGLGKLAEKHRASSGLFSNYVRDIAAELSLPPYERVDARDYVKICRMGYGKLIRESPPIPDTIIKKFNEVFKNKYKKLHRPSITNGMTEIQIYSVKQSINNPNYSIQSSPQNTPKKIIRKQTLKRQINSGYRKKNEVIIELNDLEANNNNITLSNLPELPPSPLEEE